MCPYRRVRVTCASSVGARKLNLRSYNDAPRSFDVLIPFVGIRRALCTLEEFIIPYLVRVLFSRSWMVDQG